MERNLEKSGNASYDSTQEVVKEHVKPRRSGVLNPFVDWSFKHLFGTEQSKPNLMGFLNLLLMPQSPIVEIEYLNSESLPEEKTIKGCVFDILCKDKNGERYLIEMQNNQVGNIVERIVYYGCRLIDQMGRRGKEWHYGYIKRVYVICLMNFTYEESPKLRRDIQLCDIETNQQFSDKLNIIMLQLPCLKAQSLGECNEYYQKLLFLLQQMTTGMRTIEELKAEVAATQLPQETKEVFYQVLDTADEASLSEKERMRYESNLKAYRDTMSCIKFAEAKGEAKGEEIGRAEGRAKRNLEIARSMKSEGIDINVISRCTNLSAEEIDLL